jgi:hypothetical protein
MDTSEMQMLASQTFTKDGLAQACFNAVHTGFNAYMMYDSPRAHIHNNTVKANLINSYIQDEFIRMVSGQQFPMYWNRIGNSKRIVVADRVIMRAKKIGNKGITENIPSTIVDNFRNHETDKILKTATKLIPVDIAYSLDRFRRSVTGVYLLCPNGKRNLWVTPFYVIGATESTIFRFEHWIDVQSAPAYPPASAPADLRDVANLKSDLNKKTNEGGQS